MPLRHGIVRRFLWSLKRPEDEKLQTDAQLMEQLHAELDARRVRVSKVALAIALLALVALWCWSQEVLP